MKKGILVYDRNDAEKNQWFIEHLINEGAKQGLDIVLLLTDEISEDYTSNVDALPDFAIMRNRNCEMSEAFEKAGIRCFNSSYVCRIGNNKWEMYRDFSAKGIPVMYTQRMKLPYPFVMKPIDGHGGENVFLVRNQNEYDEIVSKTGENVIRERYIFQFAASETGRDIRVYVIGDTIVTAMERRANKEGEFRANFSLGGAAEEYSLNDEELSVAAKAAKHIQADFVGIDLIYNNGKPVVNEIEDAVGTRMLYADTDIDAAAEFIKWVSNQINV